MPALPRRAALVAGLLAATGALAGCSTGSTTAADDEAPVARGAADAGAFPVTVQHAYGETTIEAEPTRVVTLGWSDQDVAAALEVAPVGAVAITWGGNDQQSTPWFDARLEELGADQPTRYSDADGAPIEDIAKLQPDLILATNSGITQEEYDKLSKLAPVVAYPDEPWTTTWEDSLEMVGQALGREELAKKVEDRTEASLESAEERYPQLDDATFVFASLSTADTSKIDYYTPIDNRSRLLEDVGMEVAPVIEGLSKPGAFYGTLSAERASELDADVFITYAENASDLATFEQDPLLGQVPGIADGHVVASTDKTDSLGLSAPSPLSIPWAMDHFVPLVARALDGS